ncbi:MAG TPA: rRNA maturation RNase YbeY [Candidatus Cloacimonadota bacterium]|nr:rRNA maturation RNase YbeY [Candidatus Cloacimonadota bacterium]
MFEHIIAKAMEIGDIKPDSSIQMLITNDREMQVLNRKYRGSNAITDILTFNADEPDPTFLGDIVIDIEQADRQKGSESLAHELTVLLIHGLLHLIGYDHIRTEDRQRMMMKEDEYRSFIKEL